MNKLKYFVSNKLYNLSQKLIGDKYISYYICENDYNKLQDIEKIQNNLKLSEKRNKIYICKINDLECELNYLTQLYKDVKEEK